LHEIGLLFSNFKVKGEGILQNALKFKVKREGISENAFKVYVKLSTEEESVKGIPPFLNSSPHNFTH